MTVKDHEGNEYPTLKKMCEHWGVNHLTFLTHINNGWTIEKALTLNNPGVWQDHEGNTFKGVRAMCKHWHVTPLAFINRRKRGASVKEALCGH